MLISKKNRREVYKYLFKGALPLAAAAADAKVLARRAAAVAGGLLDGS